MRSHKESVFIPTSAILLPNREMAHFGDLGKLSEHLENRSIHFTRALNILAGNLRRDIVGFSGWESFVNQGKSKIKVKGKIGTPGIDTFFTGDRFCTIASAATIEALSRICPSVEFYMIKTYVDKNREKWSDPKHKITEDEHVFVCAVDLKSDTTKFIDPTYAQIDHRFIGKFLITDVDNANEFYRSNGSKLKMGGIGLSTNSLLFHGQEDFGLRSEDFYQLATTLI